MKSRFVLSLGIALILIFGTLAAFNGSYSPSHEEIQKELLVQMHEAPHEAPKV